MRHDRLTRPRRPRPGSAKAVAVALTLGLLASATPVARAAESTPSTALSIAPSAVPTPTATTATEHPRIELTISGSFGLAAGETVRVGTPVSFSARLRNTGDVPLTTGSATLPVGFDYTDSAPSRTVTAAEVAQGYVVEAQAPEVFRTPTGTYIYPGTEYRLPIPLPTPQPAPSDAPAPSGAPASSAARTTEHPRFDIVITGEFVLAQGETVGVGTPVTFTYRGSNTGDVPLKDPRDGTTVAVGETGTYSDTSRRVTAEEMRAGHVMAGAGSLTYSTPAGTYTYPGTEYRLPIPAPTPAPTSTPTAAPTPTRTPARIGLSARVQGAFVRTEGASVTSGTPVRWTATVTNTGTEALRDVRLVGGDGPIELGPGATGTVSIRATPAETKIRRGLVEFAGEVSGVSPTGQRVTEPVRARLAVPRSGPGLSGDAVGSLVLAPGERAKVGTRVKWTVTLTNAGDVDVRDLQLRGNARRIDLAVGHTVTLVRYTVVTARDLARHRVAVSQRVRSTTALGTPCDRTFEGALLLR